MKRAAFSVDHSKRLPTIDESMVALEVAHPALPQPEQQYILGQSPDMEVGTFTLQGAAGLDMPIDTPLLVYSTKRRWRGIDVYVNPSFVIIDTIVPFVRIWVYAFTGGQRVLVRTGWVRGGSVDPAPFVSGGRRAVSFRGLAERFEVVCELVGFQDAIDVTIQVNVVASDECDEPSDLDSVSLFGGPIFDRARILPWQISNPSPHPWDFQSELMGAVITNTTELVKYWMALDAVTVAAAVGQVPVVSVAIPPLQTVMIPREMMRGYRFGLRGCVCGGSTSPSVLALAANGDVLQQVWGR